MSDNRLKDIANQVEEEAGYKTKVIKNNKYSIKLLPAKLGFEVGLNLVKTFLPVLGSLLDAKERSEFGLPEDESVFSEMSIILINQLDRYDISQTLDVLLQDAKVNGNPLDFDTQFRANYSELVQLTEFAIEENFGDFLSEYLLSKGIDLSSLKTLTQKSQTNQDHTQDNSSKE